MKRTKETFNQYIRDWLENYRKEKAYSMEKMSEALMEDSRSYYDQKRGKIGFSGRTVCRMLIQLTDMEILEFVRGLRTSVWGEEFQDE